MPGRSKAKLSERSSEAKLSTKIGECPPFEGGQREAQGVLFFICVLLVFPLAAFAQNPAQRIFNQPKFQAATEFISKDHDRFVRELIQITEVEAPPFKEEKRAKAFVE